jgi:hypothetical protein
MRDRWIYISVGAIIFNLLFIIYSARTRWGDSIIYGNELQMNILVATAVVVLVMTWGVVGYWGYESIALNGLVFQFVVTLGTWIKWSTLAPIIPIPNNDIISILMSNTLFSGDPVAYLIGVPLIMVYLGIMTGLASIRQSLV